MNATANYEVWMHVGFEQVRSAFDWRIDQGPWQTVPNTGVFFARATPTLPVLLDLVWKYHFSPDHVTWEQIAVRTLIEEFPAVRQRFLITGQPREFNSFPQERAQIHKLHYQANTWQPGDFLCHFSGIGGSRLPELIAQYQKLAADFR